MTKPQEMPRPQDRAGEPPSGGIQAVISGGYCVGCGSCASLQDSPCEMKLNRWGMLEAELTAPPAANDTLEAADAVCPFSDRAPDENLIGEELFGGTNGHQHEALGHYQACYAAHVTEGAYRAKGSSGGMGSWLQCELLEAGLADYVINVKPTGRGEGDELLFRYTVCANAEEVRRSSKSRYYPVELSEVMRTVREKPGRYIFVGLPCFVKAARLLCRQDPLLAERLQWFVGLVCGHLKSKRFAEYLAWQVGVPPESLESFDFRKKLPGLPADQYGVEATGTVEAHPVTQSREMRELDGGDWGRGYFKYKACDFCDDVLAETADVVVGDAWLPQFAEDWQGTNIVITRHPKIDALIREARKQERLWVEPISAEDAAKSQNAGLRHRRDGLRYRLHLAVKRGEWHPRKRFAPGKSHLSRWDRNRHRLREELRDKSHLAFAEALAKDDLETFPQAMKPLLRKYLRLNAPGRLNSFKRLAKRILQAGRKSG